MDASPDYLKVQEMVSMQESAHTLFNHLRIYSMQAGNHPIKMHLQVPHTFAPDTSAFYSQKPRQVVCNHKILSMGMEQISNEWLWESMRLKKKGTGGGGGKRQKTDRWEYKADHFVEEMRRSEEIQLLEGSAVSLCPWPGFVVSSDILGLETLPFITPAGEKEVDGICAVFSTYKFKNVK